MSVACLVWWLGGYIFYKCCLVWSSEEMDKDSPVPDASPASAAVEDTEQTTNSQEQEEDGEASDPELEELLDKSLGEFGKHVPQPIKKSDISADTSKAIPSSHDHPHPFIPSGESELNDMFSSEFISEMESQLGEAMKVISDENPELWQQFDTFTKSMGLEDLGEGPMPPTTGATTKGESSVDTNLGATGGARKEEGKKVEGEKKSDSDHMEQMLDETLRKLQENTSQPEGAGLGGLGDVLGKLDLGSDEGEDQFMKMMQGMMSTLLSKEVLYPSLVDLCKQYPDWLASHRDSVSEEDLTRYAKQLELMTTICGEFEKPSEGTEPSQATSEKILHLMQELQRYGQPPEDLAVDAQAAGMPPGLMGNLDPQKCSIM